MSLFPRLEVLLLVMPPMMLLHLGSKKKSQGVIVWVWQRWNALFAKNSCTMNEERTSLLLSYKLQLFSASMDCSNSHVTSSERFLCVTFTSVRQVSGASSRRSSPTDSHPQPLHSNTRVFDMHSSPWSTRNFRISKGFCARFQFRGASKKLLLKNTHETQTRRAIYSDCN